MTPTFDPYRALGVRRDATDAEVKAAHRRLAKRFHPDAGGGDQDRFLRIQEAYRLLADPLLRREWDARHAPGPLRADASADAPRPRGQRRPAREPKPASPPAQEPADDAARRPRSSRAYTWSASEVPWWEEGTSENRRQPGRKRPTRGGSRVRGPTAPAEASAEPAPEQTNPFDVFNRSSGAAWSSAARAYFRRGEQDLPRRGTFQYEGTHVVTGARARTAAQAEARRRAAAETRRATDAQTPRAGGRSVHERTAGGNRAGATTPPPPSTRTSPDPTAGVARDPRLIHEVRERWQRRVGAVTWPTLSERLLFALVAWVPVAIVIGYGGAAASGCASVRPGCPAYLETAQAVTIALTLGLLVALPKVAYVGAVASVGALFAALGVIAVMALLGVEVPLSLEMTVLLGVALLLGYVATAAIVVLRSPTHRPWYSGPQP